MTLGGRGKLLGIACALPGILGLRVPLRAPANLNLRGGSVLMSSASDQAAPVEKFRKDYAPTPYAISEIELDFSLHDGETAESRATTVTSRLHASRRPGADAGASLDLDGGHASWNLRGIFRQTSSRSLPWAPVGEDLELVSLAVDGVELTPGGGAYAVEGDVLSIDSSALPVNFRDTSF